MPSRPAGLVFDFDGTMVDTESVMVESWNDTFVVAGLDPVPVSVWQATIGRADGHRFDPHARLATAPRTAEELASIDAERRVDRDARNDAAPLREGVLEVLDWARASGVRLAVASSSPIDWVEQHLGRLGLRDRFVHLSCAGPDLAGKPDPATYLDASRALGIDPADGWAIEDSPTGATAALAAGLGVIACPGPITTGLVFPDGVVARSTLAGFDPDGFAW